ncbi:MAG: ATP-binding protein [Vampirovibrionales bacterium]|jgi:tetratricopeptide (TPR) repeat protein|nr:ATP-binding protein [Vampirovibrionales bacterium]
MPDTQPSEKKSVHVPRLVERRERLRTFISPAVLKRLENGDFQPVRQNDAKTDDVRESQSPLALTKRYIRYQPAVFRDRHAELVNIARFLNQPYSKVLTLVGKQGVGKLSLLRGLAELLEPRYAELLWFEVPSYGDSVELALLMLKQICQLADSRTPEELLESVISPSLWEAHTVDARQRLFEALRSRLKHLNATPTLIIVNGLDALLQRHQKTLQAPAFVEVLNFLLSFDSFKLALSGEHNCVDVLDVTPQGLKTLTLEGLETSSLLSEFVPEHLAELLPSLQAMPWLWQAMLNVDKRNPQAMQDILDEGRFLQAEQGEAPLHAPDWLKIIAFVTQRHLEAYGGEALSLLALLSVMRQPLSLQTLAQITQTDVDTLTKPMKHGLFKALMRFTVNPHTLALSMNQANAKHLQTPAVPTLDATQTPLLVELYHDIQPYFNALQAVELQRYWHHRLARFYEEEARKNPKYRLLLASDTLALEREARFHHDAEKSLESTGASAFAPQQAYSADVLKSAKGYMPLQNRNSPAVQGSPPASASLPKAGETTRPNARDSAKVKGAFSASFPDKPPIEVKPRLPEHERRGALASVMPQEGKTLAPQDLSRPYADALLELATLYTHLNNISALEGTLNALKPFQRLFSKNVLAELSLRQVLVETHHQHYKKALALLEGVFVGIQNGQYSEGIAFSTLLRLNDLYEKDADLLQAKSVQDFLRHYFEENATFSAWKSSSSKNETLSEDLKTKRVIWANALRLYAETPEIPLAKHVEALSLSVRASVEAGGYPQAVEALQELAEHLLKAGYAEKGLLCLKKAETLDALHNQAILKWTTQRNMALTLWELGHPKEAVQRLKRVLQDAEAKNEAFWQASTLFLLGELAFDSVNGVEWALNCMEKALAFGQDVLGSERYTALSQRRKQLQDERHNTSPPNPVKHNPNSPQRMGRKRRTARKLST